MIGGWSLLAVAACAPACESKSEARQGFGDASAPPPARVEVATIRDGSLQDRWVFLGEVEPLLEAQLSAGADGEVRLVDVRVGDRVEKGQRLLELDPSLAKARVAAARASQVEGVEELEQAKRDQERAERLGQSILPQAEIERDVSRAQALDARAERLRASAREAKAQLRRHVVIAPFSGVIAARHVDPGDWVVPGDRVLDLIDDTRVEIMVSGSAELARRVQAGAKATVRLEGQSVDAEVVGVVRALDRATRTAKLRLRPESVPGWLLPGSSVDVAFAIERSGEGVVVPRDALVIGAVDTRVFEVVDGKAQSITVEVVATADSEALVLGEGLDAADVVVVRGNERLRPGQDVVVGKADED